MLNRIRIAIALAVVLSVAAILPEPGYGQRARTISARPSCADCRIQNVKVVTFGSEQGPGFVGKPGGVARFGGSWILSHLSKPGSLSVFTEDGEFVRDVGRPGEGPGEFKYASRMLVHADSLFVHDAGLGRIQVYTSTLDVARTFVVEVPVFRFDLTPDGRFIVEGYSRARDRAGYPLHLVNMSGKVERSFGAEPPKIDPKSPRQHMRVTTRGADGTIWTGRLTEYVIEQWDTAGKKLAELRANVPWFQPHGGRVTIAPNSEPMPTMAGIWFDEAGRLWVASLVSDVNWRSAVGPSRAGAHNAFRVMDENRYKDTILDVIDVRSGELIARARMNQWISPASANGLILTLGEKPDGTQTVEIWRPQLKKGS